MKNKKRIQRLASAAIAVALMLVYMGLVGIFIVPGVHAHDARTDYVSLENPDDCAALVRFIAGGETEISEKTLSKLEKSRYVKALADEIPAYLERNRAIEAEIDSEFGEKLADVQAEMDEVNAEKKAVQQKVVALRKEQTGDEKSAELAEAEASLEGIRARYDELSVLKTEINAQKDAVKANQTANAESIRRAAGLAEMTVACKTGKANFSTRMDFFAYGGRVILIIAGALLLVAALAVKRVFREEKVSALPEEFRDFSAVRQNLSVEKKRFEMQKLLAPAALVILFAFFSLCSDSFFTTYTMQTILENSYYVGFLAFGVTFVIMTGGIDLSLGTNMICSALIGCYFYSRGLPLWLAIWTVPMIAALIGLLNGVLIAKLKLPPFIATLGTQMITMGLGQIVTGVTTQYYPTIGSANTWFKTALFRAGSFPIGACFLFAAFLVSLFILNRTKFGRYTLAIGSNEEAARLSGVKTDRWKIAVYTVCGLFVGLAGLFYAAVNTVIIPGTGSGQEVNGIAAVVIGGTSMSGGSGTMVGTVIGVFIMSVLKSGLSSVGLQSHWQTFFTGFVVIGAVLLDQLRTASTEKVKTEKKKKNP